MRARPHTTTEFIGWRSHQGPSPQGRESQRPGGAERIDVHSLNSIGLRLYKAHIGPAAIASREIVREVLNEAAGAVANHKFGQHFLLTEWQQVVARCFSIRCMP